MGLKKPVGYTEKEKEYSSKSWKANLAGGFLDGFGQVGGFKISKLGNKLNFHFDNINLLGKLGFKIPQTEKKLCKNRDFYQALAR